MFRLRSQLRDEVVGGVGVLVAGDVGEADVVLLPLRDDADDDALDFDGGFGGLFRVHATTSSTSSPSSARMPRRSSMIASSSSMAWRRARRARAGRRWFGAVVLEPGDVEAVAALGDPLAGELAEAAGFAGVLALLQRGGAAERVVAEGLLELGEVLAR